MAAASETTATPYYALLSNISSGVVSTIADTLANNNNNNNNNSTDGLPNKQQTTVDHEEMERAQALFDTFTIINKYYLWVLFALGFPGNCAAIVTIFRMRSIGTFPVFVVMLAVMDSLALVLKLLHYQLMSHQVDTGDAGCCVLRFLGSWTSAYSSWILVFMTLERFAAVRFPLKMTMHSGCNAHKVFTVLVVVGVVVALIYMPLLWTNEIYANSNTLSCQFKPVYEHFMNNVYYWVLGSVYAFLPFCLLTVFNLLIAMQIRSSLKVRSVMRNMQLMPCNNSGNGQGGGGGGGICRDDTSIQRQVNLMLLSATFFFIVLTFPICIYMLVDAHWTPPPGYNLDTAAKFLCQQLAFVLVDSTHAVNFYLYFLTARRFRHHFLRLLTCRRTCYCRIKSVCQQAWRSRASEVEDL